MTTIKASCPVCGEQSLTSVDFTLMVCENDAKRSFYSFECPECRDEVRKVADHHVISLLISGGVTVTVWEVPAEALEEHAGPRLSYDELLDFALLLERNEFIAMHASDES